MDTYFPASANAPQGASRSMPTPERAASAACGVALLAFAVRPRIFMDLALLATGGYLLYRGASGECPLSARLNRRRQSGSTGESEFTALMRPSGSVPSRTTASRRAPDGVDEAVAESFPASDPPSSTGAAATPSAEPHGMERPID